MTLSILCGLPGTGKSLYQVHYGCKLANQMRCNLVSNVPLDFPALRKYCGMMGYGWLAHLIDSNQVVVIPGMQNVSEIFAHKNAVVLLDEAGVFFPARSFASMPKNVLVDLAQMRKGGLNIVAACQYFEQIDKAFRMLATRAIHCAGLSQYDRSLKAPRLVMKNYFHFDPITYESWLADKKARRPGIGGFVRTRFQYAQRCESSPLNKKDLQAFKVFRSFDRLENASAYSNPYRLIPYQEINWAEASFAQASGALATEESSASAACESESLSLFNF